VARLNSSARATRSLIGIASFPGNDPAAQEYDSAGTYAFAIPFWCTTIDLILLGAGGLAKAAGTPRTLR
jgi:hypothetical protein